MESGKEQTTGKHPFDFGIKRFKQTLREAGAPQSYINKAAKAYKEKVYTKVEEVKAQMQKEFDEKQLQESKDAPNK